MKQLDTVTVTMRTKATTVVPKWATKWATKCATTWATTAAVAGVLLVGACANGRDARARDQREEARARAAEERGTDEREERGSERRDVEERAPPTPESTPDGRADSALPGARPYAPPSADPNATRNTQQGTQANPQPMNREPGAVPTDPTAASPTTPGTMPSESTDSGAERLGDGAIAQILITANSGEVKIAETVMPNLQSAAAKRFAQQMIDDHGQNKKDTIALVERTAIGTFDSAESLKLQSDADDTLVKLQNEEKDDIDLAYAKAMLKGHEEVLATIDQRLLPSAQNPQLKRHLQQTRDAVAMHRDHAKRLVNELSR
jgi:putative membrane protein